MEKRQCICIGAAVLSVAAIAVIAAKTCGCCCKKSQKCNESRANKGTCRSEKGKNCSNKQKEENQVRSEMGEEKEPPYYSENYYAKDQDDE